LIVARSAKTVTERDASEPPEGLARLIALVNAERLYEKELPSLQSIMPLDDDQVKAYVEAFAHSPFASDAIDPLIGKYRACWATFSPETRNYLGQPENIGEFLANYRLLESARSALVGIAKRNSLGRPTGNSGDAIAVQANVSELLPVARLNIYLAVNRDGRFTVPQDSLLNMLIGVRADRIRSCAVCGQIFWARRINSECCQETCRKTYNQRNSRENRKVLRKRRPQRKGR
jgi:hypothetical protein